MLAFHNADEGILTALCCRDPELQHVAGAVK